MATEHWAEFKLSASLLFSAQVARIITHYEDENHRLDTLNYGPQNAGNAT